MGCIGWKILRVYTKRKHSVSVVVKVNLGRKGGTERRNKKWINRMQDIWMYRSNVVVRVREKKCEEEKLG